MTIDFTKAEFLASYAKASQIPSFHSSEKKTLKEIAFVGRSNVGKSSLLNSLTKKAKLAKTSSTPGKTVTLNFFGVDDKLLLVDLPGYGYAKVSKEEKEAWGQEITIYLKHRETLDLLLVLFDARRELTEEDLALLRFAKEEDLPLLIIFTKGDKLKAKELKQSVEKNLHLAHNVCQYDLDYVVYSTKEPLCRLLLTKKLNQYLGAHGTA